MEGVDAVKKNGCGQFFEGFDLATIPTVFVSNRRNRGRGRKNINPFQG
jgi:hypothetical protein